MQSFPSKYYIIPCTSKLTRRSTYIMLKFAFARDTDTEKYGPSARRISHVSSRDIEMRVPIFFVLRRKYRLAGSSDGTMNNSSSPKGNIIMAQLYMLSAIEATRMASKKLPRCSSTAVTRDGRIRVE